MLLDDIDFVVKENSWEDKSNRKWFFIVLKIFHLSLSVVILLCGILNFIGFALKLITNNYRYWENYPLFFFKFGTLLILLFIVPTWILFELLNFSLKVYNPISSSKKLFYWGISFFILTTVFFWTEVINIYHVFF